jgi:hypothetical protein
MPAREVAHLRFPIGVIGRVFVQKDDGGSASGFLEIEAEIVARHGVRHSIFLPLFFVLAGFLWLLRIRRHLVESRFAPENRS